MRRFRTANGSDRIIRQLGKQLTPRILMRAVEVPVATARGSETVVVKAIQTRSPLRSDASLQKLL